MTMKGRGSRPFFFCKVIPNRVCLFSCINSFQSASHIEETSICASESFQVFATSGGLKGCVDDEWVPIGSLCRATTG